MAEIFIQTYSFSEGFDKPYDNEEVFQKVSDLGYAGVELFGPNFAIEPDAMNAKLMALGLMPISMHVPGTDMLEELIPYGKALGLSFIGIGMHLMKTPEDVHAFAKRLNELGAKSKESGMMITYHNHTQEFAPCEGKRIIDILLEETDPELVGFELDAGWCAAAGEDPVAFVNQYAGRIKLIHLKESDRVIGAQPPLDFSDYPQDENGMPILPESVINQLNINKELNCAAGKGIVDWATLKKVADTQGCAGYIVERETTPPEFASRYDVLEADIKYYSEVFDK